MTQTTTIAATYNHSGSSLNNLLTQLSIWCLWLAIIFLPFSHFLINQSLFAAAICIIVAGKIPFKRHMLTTWRFLPALLLFFVLLAVSISYSHTNLSKAFTGLTRYTHLLFLIVLIYTCKHIRFKRINNRIFIITLMICTTIAYAYQWHWIDLSFSKHWHKIFAYPGVNGLFINVLHFSVLQAWVVYLTTTAILKKQHPWLNSLLLISTLFYLFHYNLERTGIIAAIILFALACWQHISLKKIILIYISLFLTLALVLIISPAVQQRFHLIIYGLTHAKPKKPGEYTSVQYRVQFIHYSWQIIKKHPWFGSGAGSFADEYNRANGVLLPKSSYLGEPHNDFINITVQLGFVGLLIYSLFLFGLWRDISRLPKSIRQIAIALFMLYCINAFCNAAITNPIVGTLYIIMFASLLSQRLINKP